MSGPGARRLAGRLPAPPDLLTMASDLLAMASDLLAMASNLLAMASDLFIAMASKPTSESLQPEKKNITTFIVLLEDIRAWLVHQSLSIDTGGFL